MNSNEEVFYEKQLRSEEYKIWKHNAPYLYDLIMTHVLEWSSLTVQWLPITEVAGDPDMSICKLLLGTNCKDREPNSLLLAKVKIPKDNVLVSLDEYTDASDKKQGYSTIGQSCGNIEIEKYIPHEGEVNRARCMPQLPNIIASKANTGEIHIFDINLSYKRNKPNPETRLTGHSKEGYGLAWNILKKGNLLSGAKDGLVCIWDIDGAQSNTDSSVPATNTFNNDSPINDVSWSYSDENVFCSAGDDGLIRTYDSRSHVIETTIDQGGFLNSVQFSPHSPHLILCGSDSKEVCLWDRRNPGVRFHTFYSHEDSVNKVEWNPQNPNIFSSCSDDRRVHVWDISRIGAPQTKEEEQDGPPELLFIHGGHRGQVCDLNWNSESDSMLIASVESSTNSLHIWKMAGYIYQDNFN